MKTLLSAILILACLAGGGFIYYQSNEQYPGMVLGADRYWGDTCELTSTGLLVCSTNATERFDQCSTKTATYRLQTNPSHPKGLPATLEIRTSRPHSLTKVESKRFFGEGTGVCYSEGYDFLDAGIKIDRGSACRPADSDPAPPNLMFYVSETSGEWSPCEIPLKSKRSN
jgi:hypothetical protein